ncbi:hypothetical protein [Borreliella garinii]|nr:hypothetical protein [Borreliella garinii]
MFNPALELDGFLKGEPSGSFICRCRIEFDFNIFIKVRHVS